MLGNLQGSGVKALSGKIIIPGTNQEKDLPTMKALKVASGDRAALLDCMGGGGGSGSLGGSTISKTDQWSVKEFRWDWNI